MHCGERPGRDSRGTGEISSERHTRAANERETQVPSESSVVSASLVLVLVLGRPQGVELPRVRVSCASGIGLAKMPDALCPRFVSLCLASCVPCPRPPQLQPGYWGTVSKPWWFHGAHLLTLWRGQKGTSSFPLCPPLSCARLS